MTRGVVLTMLEGGNFKGNSTGILGIGNWGWYLRSLRTGNFKGNCIGMLEVINLRGGTYGI